MSLASVILATRLKFFGGGRGTSLTKTRCTICGEVDSWPHLLSHRDRGDSLVGVDTCVEYLVPIAKCADRVNPHLPVPIAESEIRSGAVAELTRIGGS